MLRRPLLLVQVTRLLCGGFVLALRLNHTICDAICLAQFMSAVAELARGVQAAPTVTPAWSRELLEARSPARPAFPHREFDAVPPPPPPPGEMIMRTFTFAPADVTAIKNALPPKIRHTATTFEVLTACLWRARTAALEVPPGDDAPLTFAANIRGVRELELPAGYYGNAIVAVEVRATAGTLLASSLGDTVEMVRAAKAAPTAEYVQFTLDVLGRCGRPPVALANLFLVSDTRHAGFHRVDFGWGLPVYGGPARTVFGVSFYVHTRNSDGEEAVGVMVVLPQPVMDRFAIGIKMLTEG